MKAKNVRPFDQVKMIGANLSSLVMFNESQKLKPDQDLKTKRITSPLSPQQRGSKPLADPGFQ